LVTLKPPFFYDVTRHNLVGWSWKFRDKLSGPSSRLPTTVGKELLTYAALIFQKGEGLNYAGVGKPEISSSYTGMLRRYRK